MDEAKFCISVEEMGKRLSISRCSAYELARSEGFPAFRAGRRLLVSVAGLEKWIAEHAQRKEDSLYEPSGF